jgi:hypothetical protein
VGEEAMTLEEIKAYDTQSVIWSMDLADYINTIAKHRLWLIGEIERLQAASKKAIRLSDAIIEHQHNPGAVAPYLASMAIIVRKELNS